MSFKLLAAAKCLAVLATLALLPLAVPSTVSADDNLRREVAALARDIKKLLDKRGDTAIAIGQFVGPPGLPSSAGPAFAKALADELRKLKVDVRVRAPLTIEGRYCDAEDKAAGELVVALEVKIVDRRGKQVVGLELKQRGIFGDATLATILGLSVPLPPDDPKKRDENLKDGIDKPRVYLDKGKTRLRAGNAPFAVEVLVKKGGTYVPLPATDKDGLAFVTLGLEDAYAVRLINDAPFEAAVTLTIDGLSMFAFSDLKGKDGQPRYRQLLVPAGKSFLVKGWHRTNEESNEFLITTYAKSKAAELGSTANIGTITATFAASWPKTGSPPADEPPDPRRSSRSADVGTTTGAAFKAKFVEVERQFGVTRGAVSVRYSKTR